MICGMGRVEKDGGQIMKFGLKERGAVFGFHSSQLPIPCPALSNKEGHINLSKIPIFAKRGFDLTSLTMP